MIRKSIFAVAVAASALAVSALAIAAARPPKPEPAPASPAAPTAADFRTPDPQNVMVIDTNKGRIIVEITPDVAPEHAERLRALTRQGFYDGKAFFRVIDGFMAQTGDPKNDGTGQSTLPDLAGAFTFRRGSEGPGVVIADRAVNSVGFVGSLPFTSQSSMLMALTKDQKVNAWGLFCPGVLGMARGDDPNSANSQFFLMRDHYPALETRYTAFGRVVSGLPVVRSIKTGEPVAPPQDQMTTVRLLADMPANDHPSVRVIDPQGPWFKAQVERRRQSDGDDFSPCDLQIPAEIK